MDKGQQILSIYLRLSMIALRRGLVPIRRVIPAVVRWMATETETPKAETKKMENVTTKIKTKMLNRLHFPHKTATKEASLLDIVDTLKCVNYRYDYPQKLTEEQKKSLKRFDIFR